MKPDWREFWVALGAMTDHKGYWKIGNDYVGCVEDNPVFFDPRDDDVRLEVLLDGLAKLAAEQSEDCPFHLGIDLRYLFTANSYNTYLYKGGFPGIDSQQIKLAYGSSYREPLIAAICKLAGIEQEDTHEGD